MVGCWFVCDFMKLPENGAGFARLPGMCLGRHILQPTLASRFLAHENQCKDREWCHQHKVESNDMFEFNVRQGIHDQFMILAFHVLWGLRFEYLHAFSSEISECAAPKVHRH